MVKSRDFVNLRSCRLFNNGKICDDDEAAKLSSDDEDDNSLNRSCGGSVTTLSDNESETTPQPGSVGSYRTKLFGRSSLQQQVETSATGAATAPTTPYDTLSKSLGAKSLGAALNFNVEPPPLDDEFVDAKEEVDQAQITVKDTLTLPDSMVGKTKNKVWLSSAISVEYPAVPATTKYTR